MRYYQDGGQRAGHLGWMINLPRNGLSVPRTASRFACASSWLGQSMMALKSVPTRDQRYREQVSVDKAIASYNASLYSYRSLPLLRVCSAGSAPLPRHTTVCAKDLPPSLSRVPPCISTSLAHSAPPFFDSSPTRPGRSNKLVVGFVLPRSHLGSMLSARLSNSKFCCYVLLTKCLGIQMSISSTMMDVACFAWPGTSWPHWPHSLQELIMAQGRGKLRLLLRTVVGAIVQSRLRCPKWGRGFGPALCSGMMPMPKLAKFNLVCGCRHGPRFSFTSSFLSLVGTSRNQGPGEQQVCVTTLDRPLNPSSFPSSHSPSFSPLPPPPPPWGSQGCPCVSRKATGSPNAVVGIGPRAPQAPPFTPKKNVIQISCACGVLHSGGSNAR